MLTVRGQRCEREYRVNDFESVTQLIQLGLVLAGQIDFPTLQPQREGVYESGGVGTKFAEQ